MSSESAQSDDIEQPDQDALESWEDGPAFGVSQDKDPVCETPVEEWISGVDITSTEDVIIPPKLVDQVIGQEAAEIVVRQAAEQRRHVIMDGGICLLYTLPNTRDRTKTKMTSSA